MMIEPTKDVRGPSETPDQASGPRGEAGQPPLDLDSKTRFDRAMDRAGQKAAEGSAEPKGRLGEARFGEAPTDGCPEPRQNEPLADLSQIISSSMAAAPAAAHGAAAEAPQAAAAAEAPAPSERDLAAGLVSRILVSEPAAGAQEVRLSVEPDLLPDTEIRLWRSPDGQLEVKLLTGDQGAFQTLVSAKDSLLAALERGAPAGARLEVGRHGEPGESGGRRRRSRGLDLLGDEER
jgi:type III secretion system needle length determinant